MNWCIASNEALLNPEQNDTIQQLIDLTCDIGVSHDGVNRVFTSTPNYLPEDIGKTVLLIELDENITGEDRLLGLVLQVGSFMKAAYTDKILVGDSSLFIELYGTPHFKLWCGNYDDKKELEADYIKVFGRDDIDARQSLETLRGVAREAIYSMLP